MRLSPILLLHICAGTVGIGSGFVAVFFPKGSRQHGFAGKVFAISMLTMAAAGIYLAFMKLRPGDVLGGTITFYLVATAWETARRKQPATSLFDWGGLLVVLTVGTIDLTFGFEAAISQTGMKFGYSPGPYFFLGSVALIALAGDVRMLVRGGVSGRQRIARHLWRMCFALFIAASSIFLARQHLFPAAVGKSGVLYLLSFLPLILMIYWLVRIRCKSSRLEKVTPGLSSLGGLLANRQSSTVSASS